MALLKNKEIGERLKAQRLATNKSMRKYAMDANIDQSQYSKIEKGTLAITDNILEKLIKVYGVNKDYILYGAGLGTNVPQSANEDLDIKRIIKMQNILLEELTKHSKTQNVILGQIKDGIQDKVAKIDANLNGALVGVDTLQLEVKSAREVILKSLARIEMPQGDEEFLLKKADNIMRNMRGSVDKKGKQT